MLHFLSNLTADRTDFFTLTSLWFPYEIMSFITRYTATVADTAVPVVLLRSGFPADFADAFAKIPFMALISYLPTLCAFTTIPFMTEETSKSHIVYPP